MAADEAFTGPGLGLRRARSGPGGVNPSRGGSSLKGMKGTGWIAATALLLAGCAGDRVRLDPLGRPVLELDVVTDDELRAAGAWTEADAQARDLIGWERGRLGQYRPTRRPPVARKFAGIAASVLTLTGWSYEKPYHHVPERGVYVFVHRDRPPSIVGEAWQGGITPPDPSTRPWPTPPRPPSDDDLFEWTRPALPGGEPPPPVEEEPVPISRADLR